MPSDKTTVATTADFAPTVVGGTDRESIVSSASRAHDGTSQPPRPGVHPEALNVLSCARVVYAHKQSQHHRVSAWSLTWSCIILTSAAATTSVPQLLRIS